MKQLEKKWGQIKQIWNKIIDNEMPVSSPQKELLLQRIQEHFDYGYEEAERYFERFMKEPEGY